MVTLWKCGSVECVVVHHWAANRYEIQLLQNGLIAERRWFNNSEAATRFALQEARKHGVDVLL